MKTAMKSLPVLAFDCDQCGACCRDHLLREADLADALREPRIAERATLLDGRGSQPIERAKFGLGWRGPCQFLQADQRCEIYATRPSMCVEFQAGSDKCQEARMAAGLSRLMPRVVEQPTVLDRIAVLFRDGT